MKIGRLALGLSAMFFAAAMLLRPLLMPDPGGGFEMHALIIHDLDKAVGDLRATVALLEALDPATEAVPSHLNGWKHSTADNGEVALRLNAWNGGRVESAASLVIAPASRYSARV